MSGAPVLLEHPSSLEHDPGPHPEQPARLEAIWRELEAHDWFGFERLRSPMVDRAVLAAVHEPDYIDTIERLCARGGGHLDLDTVVSRGSFDAALHAAGGAVALVDLLLDHAVPTGFSVHRPPGHHASAARGMGFCLFNSVAVAAEYARARRGLERVMIFDWDVHHGNGTNDIFRASHEVLFVSVHQMPLYPGTGPASDVGAGNGAGYTVNLPVAPGSDDFVFLSMVEHVVIPLAVEFAPQLVLVSAGYDAHGDDPLGGCLVTEAGFAAMTSVVARTCASLEAPLGFVLEGGYSLGGLSRSVAATLEALDTSPPVAGTSEPLGKLPPKLSLAEGGDSVAPVALEARSRVARWWPALADATL
ncbi:MAG: histone deacetylase [Actinomycetota bacterium]|nr:histone deacetylase [Actinomycetota bacterium]